MRMTRGWAAGEPGAALRPWDFARRDVGDRDVAVRIHHCGICGSDLDAVRGGGPTAFPLVPGHEIVGEITEVGSGVSRFSIGDQVAVGNIVGSCGRCAACRAGRENWCAQVTLTYGGSDGSGNTTQGGYSSEYVLDEHFVYRLPEGLDPAEVAPLMCAGVTTYSPLRRRGVGQGTAVGVVGLGGLGHVGVKLARALGAEVSVFTTSPGKAETALALGAEDAVVSTDASQMAAQTGRFDFILDTVGAPHELGPYFDTLGIDGTLCLVGITPEALRVDPMSLIPGAKSLAGSGSGGVPETQEMLDLCAEHGITADVERVTPDRLDEALDRLARNDVRHRFVLDLTG
ncbi:NAD(P)-dependent alcohol dehydrogenase [Streptomonospora salina]|uniref:NAD(P)-dependent alcohol dehydrogenase n=2 Tax=Streptomonospora salina TaxID=104205 RepID=UPI001621BA21|nr:NAD(P)-dependent alcohol dehydrogenase [Streptomonospora salina]